MRLALVTACLLLLGGCGSNLTNDTEPPDSRLPAPAPMRRERPWDDFETKLEKVFEQGIAISRDGHPGGEPAFLYASPWAAQVLREMMRTGKGPREFRSGSLIVLAHPDGTVYVMRKRPRGRLPETNDWYFALVREGRVILESREDQKERVQEACADCHSTRAELTDWVVPPRVP